jgi:uncharacterized protein (UPF0261 family)
MTQNFYDGVITIEKCIVIVGSMDTKGVECQYIKERIEMEGFRTITLDTGVLGEPFFRAEISNREIASKAGARLEDLIQRGDRGDAVRVMMEGTVKITKELYAQDRLGGIIGVGGSAGTTIGTAAMRSLPVGIPKVMVSTLASGNTRPYVGMRDITMVNTIVDFSGLNRFSRKILTNAAYSLIGMMRGKMPIEESDKPIIAATMFGVTTPCVTLAQEYLEKRGYEVLVFHATGIGGQAMENLIESGFFVGVMDITTTELADEVVGGLFSAGSDRLEAAGRMGIPQVVSVGAVDMVNFGSEETFPKEFQNGSRLFHIHNPNVTLMRTTVDENCKMGELMSKKWNKAKGPVSVYLPLKGVSALDAAGMPFYGPEENAKLFDSLSHGLDSGIEIVKMNTHINDAAFAVAMASKLVEMIETRASE